MDGPGAAVTAFGSTINLVLHLTPAAEYLDESRPEAMLTTSWSARRSPSATTAPRAPLS